MSGAKRIAVWSPYMGNVGTIRAVLNLSRGFSQSGHAVDLFRVYTEWKGAEGFLADHRIRLVDFHGSRVFPPLPRYRAGYRFSMGLLALYAFPLLWLYLQRRKPDVLFVGILGFLPMLVLRFSPHKPRVILSVQGRPTFNRFRKFLWRRLQSRADAVVALTESTRELILRELGFPAQKLHVINNPVVGEDLLQRSREPVEHPWFAPQAPPVLLAVGRLTRQKDFPTLVRAFARVRRDRDCRLLILGEGEDRAKIQDVIRELRLEDAVLLAGFTPNPYWFLANARLFVMSSLWEDNPHALLEAAYFGIPILCTDCPSGPKEFLDNGALGGLCPVGDVDKMAEAMARSLDTRRRGDSGTEGLRRKSLLFTSEASVGRYLALAAP